jgi:hypothetical protein
MFSVGAVRKFCLSNWPSRFDDSAPGLDPLGKGFD